MKRLFVVPLSGRPSTWLIGAIPLVLANLVAGVHAQQPTSAPATPTPSAETIQAGKQHFVTYTCYACHGYDGQGSGNGPRIDTTRTTLTGLVNYVRQPGGRMPPFRTERQIPDSALAEIYAYLESLPPPPDPSRIPLLRAD